MKREDVLQMAVGGSVKMKADRGGGYRVKGSAWTAE